MDLGQRLQDSSYWATSEAYVIFLARPRPVCVYLLIVCSRHGSADGEQCVTGRDESIALFQYTGPASAVQRNFVSVFTLIFVACVLSCDVTLMAALIAPLLFIFLPVRLCTVRRHIWSPHVAALSVRVCAFG